MYYITGHLIIYRSNIVHTNRPKKNDGSHTTIESIIVSIFAAAAAGTEDSQTQMILYTYVIELSLLSSHTFTVHLALYRNNITIDADDDNDDLISIAK